MDRIAGRRGIVSAVSALTVVPTMLGVSGLGTPPATTAADIALVNGLALVMGPTNIPQPGLPYLQSAQDLYLAPAGFTGVAASLYTPETPGIVDPNGGVFSPGTDPTVNADVADLVDAVKAAVEGKLAVANVNGLPEATVGADSTGIQYGTAENPLWVFGYSQSAAAASIAMMQLRNDPATADSVIHFVLVGDPAASQAAFEAGETTGTGLLSSPLVQALDTLFPGLPAIFGIATVAGLTTPNDAYPTDVYTLQNDPYADFPVGDFSDAGTGGAAGSGEYVSSFAAFVSGFLELFRFFVPQYANVHEDYLGMTAAEVAGAATVPDGEVLYHIMADGGVGQAMADLFSL